MSHTYSLTVINHAAKANNIMVFQNDPGSFAPNALSLAWFSKFSNPGERSTTKFTWTVDWGFSWADAGPLSPGVVYDVSDSLPISDKTNKVILDYNGAYFFTGQTTGAAPNRFYISETGAIPVNASAAVGITMSGSTVYAAQATPNTTITASPHPVYYVAYGEYQQGAVIDISSINQPLELPYETGIYSLTTTLNKDNSWTPPTTTAVRNAAFLKARKSMPALAWTDDTLNAG